MKRTPLKRSIKPIRQRSKKMIKLMEVRGPLRAEILEERSWCERCLIVKSTIYGSRSLTPPYHRSTQVHELLTRARGGDITDKANCVALCDECHRWIHNNSEAATRDGWLKHAERPTKVIPRRYE